MTKTNSTGGRKPKKPITAEKIKAVGKEGSTSQSSVGAGCNSVFWDRGRGGFPAKLRAHSNCGLGCDSTVELLPHMCHS
jgi:hypothetical protein